MVLRKFILFSGLFLQKGNFKNGGVTFMYRVSIVTSVCVVVVHTGLFPGQSVVYDRRLRTFLDTREGTQSSRENRVSEASLF